MLIRVTGDIIALSPPLIVERAHIDRIVECVGSMLRTTSWRCQRGRRVEQGDENALPVASRLCSRFCGQRVFASMVLNVASAQTSAEPAEQPVTLPAGPIVAQGAAVQATPMPAEPPRSRIHPSQPPKRPPSRRRRAPRLRLPRRPRDSGTGEPGAEVQRPDDGGGLRRKPSSSLRARQVARQAGQPRRNGPRAPPCTEMR